MTGAHATACSTAVEEILNFHINSQDVLILIDYVQNIETRTYTELKEKKLYPGPGLKPGPLALRANALTTALSRTSADL